MLDFLKLNFQPKANPDAIIQTGPVRFTLLTPRLIRLEYDPNETFEDRPTQVFWYRQQPVPEFKKTINNKNIVLETDALLLDYQIQDLGFHKDFLQIELKETGFIWNYEQENNTNLGGTVRTLDKVDGATPLNPGLISRTGWAVVDDSKSLVFNKEGWLETRSAPSQSKDLYFFGYGQHFTECIADFQKISGNPPVLPHFALGNWWSRYWAYHQDEIIILMREFKERKIPLSVCIVDMDWHITETGNESPGWTGYTWNKKLFPDPQRFFDDLDDLGLNTALNLHPASGVYPHEEQYETMAECMGVDPETQKPIPFNIADPEFAEAYFDILHHPLEEMGVDFWWLDWQQGMKTTIEGLDPLFWLNHLHFYDRARDGKTRSFIFSRWGGLGSQRYPIGFSGDTYVTWESLQFQPYFTATAANVGYGWWSHDIGGHMGGIEESELYLRWVQFGVFSPILRLHSTNNLYHERRPWGYDSETELHASEAMRLRHALIPYLYTAAWINHKKGILPIRPMYHLYPDQQHAYHCPNQYTFGSELIAAPFTTPRDHNTHMSRQVVWLPEGNWFDFFSGDHFQGGGWYAIYGQLDKIPVFAKAGAIVPLESPANWGVTCSPDALTVHIFPGGNNAYQLYEDDGETLAYQKGEYALTTFRQSWSENKATFEINPVEGDRKLLSQKRIFRLIFHAVKKPQHLLITIDKNNIEKHWHYDEDHHQLIITDVNLSVDSHLIINLHHTEGLMWREDIRKSTIEQMLKVFKMNTYIKSSIHDHLETFLTNPTILVDYVDHMKESHLLALIETWIGKQPEKIAADPNEAFQKIINKINFLM
jgi:alpha-glucosidase (family GH31 glycosyl hydrolase)